MIRTTSFLAKTAFLGGVAIAASVATCRIVAAENISDPIDHWYAVRLMNKPVGWAHMWLVDHGAVKTSHATMHIELRRVKAITAIEFVSRFDETDDGQPIQSVVTLNMGLKNTTTTMRYMPTTVEIVVEQLGQQQRRVVDRPKQHWLPPAAAVRYVKEQIAAGLDEISFWSVDSMAGVEPFETRMKLRERDHIELLGKVVPAMVWDTTISLMPGMVSKLYTDERGHDLKTTIDVLPGISFELVSADRQVAQAQTDPPEMLLSMLVEPDRPISDPRGKRSLVYEVQFGVQPGAPATSPETAEDEATARVGPKTDGVAAAPRRYELPTTGTQRVRWVDRRTAVVAVSLDDPVAPGDDRVDEIHLRASSMLNHEDPQVRRLAQKALADGPKVSSDAEKAERLRHFVRDYVRTKDLSVGFASASEVARTAQGDCSEHAVLLAAMLRAEGVPSRVVSGVIYTAGPWMGRKDVFVYHMWTQAWLASDDSDGARNHRWIDLDATRRVPYDATHIALSHSTLDDSEFLNELVRLAPMIGNLSIKVMEAAK